MPKCPKCNSNIDYLVYYGKALEKASLFLSDSKTAEYDNWDTIGIGTTPEYECPECNEVLFTDEEEAVKFLKNAH